MTSWKRCGIAAILILGLIVSLQFGPKNTVRAQTEKRPTGPTFESQFWNYLRQVHYRNWAPAPGQKAGHYPGKSPHGAFLKTYVNRIAAADPKELPHGSIIIKENYDKEKKLAAITVMYRVKGFDSKHNDWYWVKYNPDGTVATTPAAKGGKPIAGSFKSCIDCHSTAKGGDYYFANDK